MKKFITAIVLSLSLMASPAFAQDGAAQEANKAAHAAQVAAASTPAQAPTPPPTQVGQAAQEVSSAITNALAQTARTLNVELQDLAKSRLGFFLMTLIVFHLAGDQINQWIVAFVWLFFTATPFFWWIRRTFGVRDEKGKFQGLKWTPDNKEEAPMGAIIASVFAIGIMLGFAIFLP